MYSSLLQLLRFKISSSGHLLRGGVLRLVLVLLLLATTPTMQAVTPAPDGGYANGNTAEGQDALFSLTTGTNNTALGFRALYFHTTGDGNTATGVFTLLRNETGNNNTASGVAALNLNTDGHDNTASGAFSLHDNTTGDSNTATGANALDSNQTGGSNTATGASALGNNTGGSLNTANGTDALFNNTTAFFNTAMGSRALYHNTTGLSNTATGYQALYFNQTGGSNTATGVQALYRATGGGNIALGFQAGVNLTTGGNNIDIGNAGAAGEAGKIRIGTKGTHNGAFVAGISGVAVTGSQVVVNSNGKLGVTASSARFKEAVKPMDEASEAIHQLQPVTFRYKEDVGSNDIPQFGLIAEDVEKVSPELVLRDEGGKAFTVRYEAVSAMLLNEFLKEHKQVQDLKGTVAQQQKQIEALAAIVQKVTAQLELSKASAQLANN